MWETIISFIFIGVIIPMGLSHLHNEPTEIINSKGKKEPNYITSLFLVFWTIGWFAWLFNKSTILIIILVLTVITTFLFIAFRPPASKRRFNPNFSNLKEGFSEFSEEIEDELNRDRCYVYIMLNVENGYYKIGISNNPKYREKTLQSQEPFIETVDSAIFPNRQLARAVEKGLHTKFKRKRIRGEWFELTKDDVAEAINIIKR